MGLIKKLKKRIMPGPVRASASIGLRGTASVSWKPPILKRKRLTKRLY